MVLKGVNPEKIKIGDTIVYMSGKANYPVIHRIINIKSVENKYIFTTKGDHNAEKDTPFGGEAMIGKAICRVPLLGWVKIGFVELINIFKGV